MLNSWDVLYIVQHLRVKKTGVTWLAQMKSGSTCEINRRNGNVQETIQTYVEKAHSELI